MIRTLKNTALILLLVVFTTCIDDSKDKYTTFEEDSITSLLEKEPERYSEFLALLKDVGLYDLLNAYGTYTCFAPTNDALRNYYAETGKTYDQMTLNEKKELTYNHILLKRLISTDFPIGVLSYPNMSERFLSFTIDSDGKSIIVHVNNESRIIGVDMITTNGVVHVIDRILAIYTIRLPYIIDSDPRFSLFTEALFATAMSDSMLKIKDTNYEQKSIMISQYGYTPLLMQTPPFYLYGYTAFIESDSTYAANNIHNLNDLKIYAAVIYDKMYPEDKNITDVTDRRNSLNRFVSYHLMDRSEASNEFFTANYEYYTIPNTVMYEYREMMSNTLMEMTTLGGLSFNRRKDGTAIKIISPDHYAENGVFHEINQIMTYDENLENDVLYKRLRMDVASLLSEMTNNKIRSLTEGGGDFTGYAYYDGFFKNMSLLEGTMHYQYCKCWWNYQGDEYNLNGKYDFVLRLPPIPPGTYEIRLGFLSGGVRGVTQIYLDNQPCGIPLDMKIGGTDARIGWIADSNTDDKGVENDKMMRNRGYMKAPNTIMVANRINIARNVANCLRKILTTRTFTKTEAHYLRFKCVEETARQFHLDYVEITPFKIIENESPD